ncbi:MAG: GTPase Era [Oscillospiraceae bacterium]|jgi:GTP-binding protein Era|nr:GTPase Era [Oscillospiraceae bacterium]
MTKNIFVSIVGRPNVGKSSLLNRLLGEKIAIVSDKPQTTRNRITGVLTEGETQYVFIDTPGLHKPKSKLGQFMVKQAGSSVSDVDAVILVTEWDGSITVAEKQLVESIKSSKVPAVLAINKVDALAQKELMLKKIAEFANLYTFDAVVPISALKGEGVATLLKELEPFCCEGEHFFPDDTLTDQPERAVVSEIIREKLLRNMRDEIPHGTAVIIEKMSEREDGSLIDIDATIVCERDAHKGIIIGKQGTMLKKIASEARHDMERFLDVRVNLQCWVKVREGWRDSDTQLKNFGFREQ